MPMKGGGGGGGKDVRAGGAFVEIFGKDNLTAMLKKMQAKVLAFSKFLSSAGTASIAAGAALAAPLAAIFGRGVSRAAEMDRLAQSFGVGTEELSRLAHAAEIAGVSLEEVYQNQAKYSDLIKKSPGTDVATSKAAASAMQSFRSALVSLQAALAPAIEAFAPFAKALATFAQTRPDVVRTLAALAGGLLAVGVALKVLGTIAPILSAVGAAIPAVVAAAPWLLGAAAIGALVVGLGYAVQQTGLFSAELKKLGEVASKVFGFFKSIALDLYKTVGTTLGGIMDAFKAGDMALAMEIGMKGIDVAWKRMVLALTEVWVGFKDVVVDGWHKLASGAVIAFRGIGPTLENFFLGLWEKVRVAFFDMLRGIVNAAQDVLRQLPRGDRLASQLDPIKGELDTAQIKGTEEIQKAMQKNNDSLAAMFREEDGKLQSKLAANAAFREGQMATARGELEKATGELEQLREQARQAANVAGKPGDPDLLRYKELFSGIPAKDDLFKQARGGFGSSASLGQFGYGDKDANSTGPNIKKIAQNTGGMMKELQDLLVEFKKTNGNLEKFAIVGN